MFGNTNAGNKKEKSDTNKEENTLATNMPSVSKIPRKSCGIKTSSKLISKGLNQEESSSLVQESVGMCQSLISPKTLLNGTTTPLWGHNRRLFTAEAVTNVSPLDKRNCPSTHNNNNSSSSSSLVLCSTIVGCFSNPPQTNQLSKAEETVRLVEGEQGSEFLVESEDRCGSYDEAVSEGHDVSETERDSEVHYVSDFDSVGREWEESDHLYSLGGQDALRDNMAKLVTVSNNFETQKMTNKSSATPHSTNKMRSHVNVLNHVNEIRQHSALLEPSNCFAVPKTITHKTVFKTCLQEKSNESYKNVKANAPFPFRHKAFTSEKTSTPCSSFARPRVVIPQHTNHKDTPKSSFTIFTDPAKVSSPSSCGSFCTSKKVLSSLSTNTLSSRTNRSSISAAVKGGQKITSPLCACGRRAKRQVVSNGGPNHGRGFYCCPVRRSGGGGRIQKGCEFFKWESALLKSSSVASPAAGSSVSLCQINSTLSCRPPQRSMMRKSY